LDIADWLRGLSLERYAETFRDNAIELEVLPELSEADLEKLGVLLGHRKIMLKAIAALRAPAPQPVAEPTPPRGDAAERRQLTVMFCDLVGSTALSTRFDPEDLRELIGGYHRAVAETVGRFDGFVAKYMGDGVLIYFGYPQAHEDDAERAVRAGLAVIDAVAELALAERLNVRLGVASGLVVVGDLIGAGAAQERGVVGETPNLAARLQAVAQPGTLVISEGTRRQIGSLFEIEDLGPRSLAGFAEAQRAWRVVGESGIVSRFEALRSEATPLVGRDEELGLLLRRWQLAKAGEGRVVLLSGEPGIGKSRLTAALSQAIQPDQHTRIRYFCSPHHQDSALHPFITQLERAAGFARDDTGDRKLGKLRSLLASDTRGDDETQLLAELLSLPNSAADLNLSPQRKRQKLFEGLLYQLEALARGRPVLMVFEDAHWIDPSSRELLDLTLDRVTRLPVFLLVTFRPEFQHVWGGQPHVSMLALNRLGERDGVALVERLAGNAGLSHEIVEEIVERADGVPLFVEELTKAVLETAERDNRVAALLAASPLPNLAIPATLHASLIARLDRLGPVAKEVAQIGAVIGREFAYELIQPVAQRPEPDLEAALDRLTNAGLLFCRGAPPHSSYLFKHSLVQDAAYATLLRARRQQLHGAIAAALEREFAEIVAAQPEVLAQHCTEAGLVQQAVDNWLRAGERAIESSANLEAAAHFGRGIEVLKTLPESAPRDEQELVLQVASITPLLASRGFGSVENERVTTRALELSRRIGADTAAHFWALYGANFFYHVRGEIRLARDLAQELLGVAQRLQDRELLAYGHFAVGDTLLWFGELGVARTHLEQALALYDPERGREAAFRRGFNCGSNSYLFLTRVLWHLGYPDQAVRSSQQAIAIAGEISHPFSLAGALSWGAALHQLRREAGRTLEVADADLALTTEQIIPFYAAQAMVLRGWALVEQGRREEGITQLREGLAAYRATGAQLECSHWLALLAEAYRDTGQPEEGLRLIAEALDHVAQTGIVYYEPELHRLEGELRLCLDQADRKRAETSFRQALETARQQQAKSWELRAATSLARLWGEQGRRAEARELLAPVYGWFTEGFDTPDLKDAKALLDELT
jgi:class 3 adenylate cyclase/predicted ATPase/energy-coupling factor transporter ATP-binding protein EcfA2